MSAQSRVTSRCEVAHSGRENLHQFLPVLLRGMLPLFSIMMVHVLQLFVVTQHLKICLFSIGVSVILVF